MDVLIVERDELVGSMLADTLAEEGISAAVAPDDQALALPPSAAPRIVITGINRGHNEDLTGLRVASALLCKWPQVCVIYLAALWPTRLRHHALAASERFLAKLVRLTGLTRTVRALFGLRPLPAAGVAPCLTIVADRSEGRYFRPLGPGDSRDLPGARRRGPIEGSASMWERAGRSPLADQPHHRREQGRHRGGGRLIAEKGRVLASLASMPMWR